MNFLYIRIAITPKKRSQNVFLPIYFIRMLQKKKLFSQFYSRKKCIKNNKFVKNDDFNINS